MRSASVETVPGGLLDFLLSTAGIGAPTDALARGRAWEASQALEPLSGCPVPDAWHYVARHSALLAMPDDGALSYVDTVDPRPPWPHLPEELPPDHPDRPVTWALVQLCGVLRDLRGMLPPLADPRTSPAATLLRMGREKIGQARTGTVPYWRALNPYLDLLEADLAARAGEDDQAWSLLASARSGFAAQGNGRAVAAAVLTAGDWYACPFASPSTWGLALASPSSQDSSLADTAELLEQSPPADAERAAAAYDEAEALYVQHGDPCGVAYVAWRRAYLHYATGEPARAAAQARTASRALAQAGDERAALVAQAQSALAALADGELPDIGDIVRPVADWARGPGSLSHAIGIGRMFARTGRRWGATVRRCELALASSSVAEELWAALGRTIARSQARADQAEALRTLGARHAAIVMIESAIDIATPPLTGEVTADIGWSRPMLLLADLHNLASKAMDTGAMDRALRRLDAFAAALHDPANRATPEQSALADQLLGLVADLDQQVIGILYRAQEARDAGDTAGAARLFAAAEAAVPRTAAAGDGLPLLAIVRSFELRLAEAAAFFREWLAGRLTVLDTLRPQATSAGAAALLRQQERATRSQAVFFAVRTRDTATARTQLEALKALAHPWWSGLGTSWEHEDVEGRLLEAEGDLGGAFAAFGRAIDAVERVRADLRRDDLRVSFGADRIVQQVYSNAARVALRRRELLDPGDPGHDDLGWTAVRMLELGRSRALMDLLAAPDPGLPPAVLDAWRGAQAEATLARDRLAAALGADAPDAARVADRRDALRAAEEQLEAQVKRLRTADPRFWQLARPMAADAVEPAAVAAGLPDGDLMLIFSIDRPDLVSVALTADGLVSAVWSREERRIEAAARHLLSACRTGGAWREPAGQLGAILLEPHAGALGQAARLHVVASGPLLGVPFPTLPVRGRRLADRFPVTILPSLSAYPILASSGRRASALCVGDPARMSYRPAPESPPAPLPPLAGAGLEATAVAAIYGAGPLVGPAATERAVRDRLPGAQVVHLATHGIVDAESPLASSVLLADGEALTVAELLSLRMDADLVVLSACQTGTGTPIGGDELLGLGRALVAAGARAAVVTLWPVDDACTVLLMVRFHAALARGLTSAEALHDAQQWTRGLTMPEVRSALDRLTREVDGAADRSPAVVEVPRLVSTAPPPARHDPLTPSHPAIWAPFVLIGR